MHIFTQKLATYRPNRWNFDRIGYEKFKKLANSPSMKNPRKAIIFGNLLAFFCFYDIIVFVKERGRRNAENKKYRYA